MFLNTEKLVPGDLLQAIGERDDIVPTWIREDVDGEEEYRANLYDIGDIFLLVEKNSNVCNNTTGFLKFLHNSQTVVIHKYYIDGLHFLVLK